MIVVNMAVKMVAMIHSNWRRALFCAVAVLLSSCGGNSGGSNPIVLTGFVRVVNSVPDSPTLSTGVTVNALARASFGQSTQLVQLFTGNYVVTVQYTNAAGTVVRPIPDQALALPIEEQATLYVMGDLDTARAKWVVNPLPILAAGEAQVQFVHTATGLGAVEVHLTDAAAPLAGGTSVTLAFEAASDLLDVAAGDNYRLRVTDPGGAVVLYDSGPFEINSMGRATFVLLDYFGPGGNGFRVVKLTNLAATTFPQEALPSALRIANMVGGEAAIDVTVGAATYGGVDFDAITATQELAAGEHDVTVTQAGVPANVLFTGKLTISPGETRTLLLSKIGANVGARSSLDSVRRISVQPQLQILQASPASGNVDIYLLKAGETVDDVDPGLANVPPSSTTSVTPAAGTYGVVVTATGSKAIDAGPVPVTLEDGGIYSIYISDTPAGTTPPQIVLGDDLVI
jgi:hypothetical protein